MELFMKTKTMRNKNLFQKILIGTAGLILLNACSSIPKGATAIKPFDKAKYLGKWFEIARMDFSFRAQPEQYNRRIFTK